MMNVSVVFLLASAASAICSIGAIYLAATGVEGWGWFLFAAVLSAPDFNAPKIIAEPRKEKSDTT